MSQKYDVVCTNPPKNIWAKENSFISMITMESWMFLSGFEELRTEIVKEKNIFSLVHMPYEGRGRTSLGINFGTSAFIIRNCSLPKYAGNYNYLKPKDWEFCFETSWDFKKHPLLTHKKEANTIEGSL
jgi:hypothetical protein